MTTQRPTTLQYSDLIGRLVLDRSTADEMGHVDQLWLDPGNYRVSGFTCKSGVLGQKRRSFHWSQIVSLGADGILVQSAAVEPAKPDTTAAVIGHEVWTDAGSKAGVVKDYQIALGSGQVLSYLFVSNGWRAILDGLYALPPQAILSIGPKRIIVSDSAIQQAQLFEEGLTQKVTHAAAHFKDDYAKTRQGLTQELTSVVQDTQAIASNLQHNTQQAAQQAAQKATARAKETLSDLQHTTRQATTQATAQAKQKLSGLVGQLQDKTQQVTQQAQEKLSEVKNRWPGNSGVGDRPPTPPKSTEPPEDDPLEDWD